MSAPDEIQWNMPENKSDNVLFVPNMFCSNISSQWSKTINGETALTHNNYYAIYTTVKEFLITIKIENTQSKHKNIEQNLGPDRFMIKTTCNWKVMQLFLRQIKY